MMLEGDTVTVIGIDGDVYSVEWSEQNNTFADLKRELLQQGKVSESDLHQLLLVSEEDEVCQDDQFVDTSEDFRLVRPKDAPVSAPAEPVASIVHDDMQQPKQEEDYGDDDDDFSIQVEHTSFVAKMKIDIDRDTVGSIVERSSREINREIKQLTFHGRRLDAHERLMDLNLRKDGSDVFKSLINVMILDAACELQTPLEVYDFFEIQQVKQIYEQTARRVLHQDCVLRDEDGRVLRDDEMVYQCKIHNDATLNFSNPEYAIIVVEKNGDIVGLDGDAVQTLIVEDHFTVDMVKELYSDMVNTGLVEGDKLHFGSEELAEEQRLYVYKITSDSRLEVEREDVTQIVTTYLCANCGSDVQLKQKQQGVRCMGCGYRIVFKKRTDTVYQCVCR